MLRALALLLLVAALSACTQKEEAPPEGYVLAEVGEVREEAFGYAVLLKAVEGDGRLVMVVSREQGERMRFLLAGEKPPRPWMHHTFAALLAKLGKRVSYVSVDSLVGDTYYASIHVPGVEPIDARPSDAIILALIEGAPIYVNSQLLEKPTVPGAIAA
ncbi:MAG: bifunctional nuclease family protein [Euryarchaeota archaeon]|nr:bifunctional nuclease family protein [Euryarchaeota archaeon]